MQETKIETCDSKTLQQLTGLSERRLYHWVSTGVIPQEYILSGKHPGTGGRLVFDTRVIKPVRFLVNLAQWAAPGHTNGMSTR